MTREKKRFVKTDIEGGSESASPPPPASADSASAGIAVPPDPRVFFKSRSSKSYSFESWYGCGVDSITGACQQQIERFLLGMDSEVTHATVVTYCQNGMTSFLEYTALRSAALQRQLGLADVNRELIDGYLGYLDGRAWELVSKKSKYDSTKAVLRALCDRGLINEIFGGDAATFPPNPFPGAHRHRRGHKPLTAVERSAFSVAIKKAVMPLFAPDVEPTSELLAYALLVIALHTGRNTTPLIEMGADCLRPHPKTGVQFLVLFKRRGYAESKVALQGEQVPGDELETVATLRPTVVRLIQRVIALAERLRPEAPEDIRDSVWLYRMRSHGRGTGTAGEISALTDGTLAKAVKILVRDYGLTDADGAPLKVNVSRLRKSFINRIFEILDGDIVATAAAAGNTVRVAGISYLRPDEDSARNWRFMGLALVDELLSGAIGKTERTPVARCSDARNGHYAPKRNDLVCTSFLNCIRCRNLVVTADDLYRLFSFYWRIFKERAKMDPQRWKKQMAHIIRLIDRDVIDVGITKGIFKQSTVDRERHRAFRDPHPFWRMDVALTELETMGSV
ncbi:hypothetical protein SAMN05446935_1340 [Burkholderia sp. YR290]|nr:hypothetical protein SAMN05446935_1340 [Burkholderia sp. YR290]